jgi:hypothetical protein
LFGQDDSKSQEDHARAESSGTPGFGFPLTAQLRQEVLAWCTGLRQFFVAAVSVEAYR